MTTTKLVQLVIPAHRSITSLWSLRLTIALLLSDLDFLLFYDLVEFISVCFIINFNHNNKRKQSVHVILTQYPIMLVSYMTLYELCNS